MLKKISIGVAVTGTMMIASCSSNQEDTLNKTDLVDTSISRIEISDETLDGIMNSIPSPLETTTLIKESGLTFNESYLNPAGNADFYASKNSKSFAIGVYSADLGYLNLYDENIASVNYIVAIRKLSSSLAIDQFFDFETLKALASNKKNMDSLLYVSTSCFDKMNAYLKKNKRSEQSALIIIGAWMEGLYFETEMAKLKPSEKIKENIGSQKVAVDNVMAILEALKQKEYFNQLRKQMLPLKELFDKVEISYDYKEPEVKEVNGELVVVEKSESKVTLSDEEFNAILKSVPEIRNRIIASSN